MSTGLQVGINPAKLMAAIPKGIKVDMTGERPDTLEEAAAVASDVLENLSAAMQEMSADPKICLLLANALSLLPKEDAEEDSGYSFEIEPDAETVKQKKKDNKSQGVFSGDFKDILSSIISIGSLFKK